MANLRKLRNTWNRLGKRNAFWAVLSTDKQWDERAFFETGRREVREILATLHRKGVTIGHDQALDFGCGVGRLTQPLSTYFRRVTGVDIANSMIRQARVLNSHRNVRFVRLSSGNLHPFETGYFDFILSDIVLQHMSNKLALVYIREMYRTLKNGGVLVLQMPSKPALTWKGLLIRLLPNNMLTRLRKGMEMHPIAKVWLLNYFAETGFEVIGIEKDSAHRHWEAYFYYVRKPMP